VPAESLESFPPEFQQGMAARATVIGDTGENSPDHWEKPLAGPEVHVLFAALAPDRARLDAVLETARSAYEALDGVAMIWRQDCYALPSEREAFGFRDGISHPAVEGSGVPGTNPKEPPLKAGEFILGYADEIGFTPPPPKPEVPKVRAMGWRCIGVARDLTPCGAVRARQSAQRLQQTKRTSRCGDALFVPCKLKFAVHGKFSSLVAVSGRAPTRLDFQFRCVRL
jgi:hypothetical protein